MAHTIQRILGKPSHELSTRLHRQIFQQLGKDYDWPGNVRELEQCVRRLLINRRYEPLERTWDRQLDGYLHNGMDAGSVDAQTLIAGYCYLLYKRHGTYEAVARRTRLIAVPSKNTLNQGCSNSSSLPEKQESMGNMSNSKGKSQMADVVAQAVRERKNREKTYRERALKLFDHVCGRCGREFEGKRLRELTVHHRDHNHDNNPPDGSNWELLCVYCHDNEHSRELVQDSYNAGPNHDEPGDELKHQPFAGLEALLKKGQKD